MRDIPVFTTEYGVASLVLKEIPYKGAAYITLQSSMWPEKLLQECVAFCRMAGAEHIYATGHVALERFPLYTIVIKMQQLRDNLPEGEGCLFPVTEETAEQWRSIYNEKMRFISNAATITKDLMKQYLLQGGCYFVHRENQLLGIGLVNGDKIEAIAACVKGAGKQVLLTICNAVFAENVVVEVSSTNIPAICLYENFGFQRVAELSRWYDVGKI